MSTFTPKIEMEHSLPSQDARWLLARRIANSATFARSEQLPKLLLYVCKMAISERGDEINEQRIGVDVYGRSPDYDPAIDGIVRSHATRLRQKLESYFRNEGRHEPMRIDIPRGGYVPRFYTASSEVSGESSNPVFEVVPDERSSDGTTLEPSDGAFAHDLRMEVRVGKSWIWPFFAGLVLALAAAGMVIHHLRHDSLLASGRLDSKQSEIEHRFWSTLFPANGKTIIVSGDSGLVLYETLTGRMVTLSDYIDGSYRDPSKSKDLVSTASRELTFDLASRRYSSFADLELAAQLSHLPEWTPERSATIFARDLRPADAGTSNLILIGSRQANPWVSLIEPSMNFVLAPDGKRGFYFLNRHPRDNEQQEYIPKKKEDGTVGASVVYGDVIYLPNPNGHGMILSLSGLWMTGTQSAGNFVLNSTLFSNWLRSIAEPNGTIPPFELLIATQNLQGSATNSSIVAKRVGGKQE